MIKNVINMQEYFKTGFDNYSFKFRVFRSLWSLLCKCFEPTIMNSKYVRIILRYILNIRKYNYIFFVYEISSIVFSKSQI